MHHFSQVVWKINLLQGFLDATGKMLKALNKQVYSCFWVSNSSIRSRIGTDDTIHMITHYNDLEELFPGNQNILDKKQNVFYLLQFVCVHNVVFVGFSEPKPSLFSRCICALATILHFTSSVATPFDFFAVLIFLSNIFLYVQNKDCVEHA